ncbi:MAG: transporter [Herbaspirillum sp.]|jgi:NodT family efflux transporter outer membrane factor (OMF) lipoprotein|nr:transporter [Herbaspirillum sp.]
MKNPTTMKNIKRLATESAARRAIDLDFGKLRRPLSCALLGLTLAGCAVGPDYVKPTMDIPDAYKESALWKTAQPMDESPRGPWWTVCKDPRLDQLMDTLNRQSPTIAQAEAQYRQAEALMRQARSGLFPTVGVSASASRGASGSSSSSTSGNTGNVNSGRVSTIYDTGVSASWEADVWGRVRRSVEAGEAGASASAAQLAAIRLSSQAQLATAYLELVVADQQLRQLRDSEKTLQETLTLTQNQFAAGTVSDANVALAESQLKTAQVQTVDKQLTRALLEHAIAAALGQAPSRFSLAASDLEPQLPQIPPGLPSTLLERRPDIAAAERNVAAANANIGVAKAAFFPTLTLSASGGYNSNSFADWISLPNRFWSLGPQLALTLFDGGLRRAQTDQAIAAYDANVAAYRMTVLSAFQAVEDNLASQALLAQQADLESAALAAARRSETITLNQYRAGIVGYIEVLTAQNTRLSAESSLWNIKNRQYVSSIALIAAIGGQW